MSTEKATALVLRLVDFSETSVVATLFTREFGKVTALAKGARRPKGPFEAALDLLAECRIVFIHKPGETLDLLTEARLERRFKSSRTDVARLYAGYYVAELLREMTEEADPHPNLFDFAQATLGRIDDGADLFTLILQFELKTLLEFGRSPALTHCVDCGKRLDTRQGASFAVTAGGVLCERHRGGKRQVVRLSAEAIGILAEQARRVEGANSDSPKEPKPIQTARRGELRAVMNRFLASLLRKQLRMTRYMTFPLV